MMHHFGVAASLLILQIAVSHAYLDRSEPELPRLDPELKLPRFYRDQEHNSDTTQQFDTTRLWLAWKTHYQKQYESNQHETARLEQFAHNYNHVRRHNERFRLGLEPFDLSLNRFADMTRSELRSTLNGFKPEQRLLSLERNQATRRQMKLRSGFRLPDHVDWRDRAVTKVMDQGHCGCCWAFSATGALEGQYFLKTGHLASLSEQNLIDCSGVYGNHGCQGGLMDNAFEYVERNGIDTDTAYPFEGRDQQRCRFSESNQLDAKVTGFVDLPSGDERALAEAVARVGPVSVAIDASHRSMQLYTAGVYVEPECGNTTMSLDHAVLVVGYGTDPESGMDYWLVKNSWSSNWGEQGYFRLARNRGNMCGIASMATYPILQSSLHLDNEL